MRALLARAAARRSPRRSCRAHVEALQAQARLVRLDERLAVGVLLACFCWGIKIKMLWVLFVLRGEESTIPNANTGCSCTQPLCRSHTPLIMMHSSRNFFLCCVCARRRRGRRVESTARCALCAFAPLKHPDPRSRNPPWSPGRRSKSSSWACLRRAARAAPPPSCRQRATLK